MLRGLLWLAIWICCLTAAADDAAPFLFQHENVLGTSLELRVAAVDQAAAQRAEIAALAEIERLAKVLSGYDDASEFSRWQQSIDEPLAISADLLAVLVASDRWMEATNNAYHPGAELLSRRWSQAAKEQRIPGRQETEALAAMLAEAPWSVDSAKSQAKRTTRYPLSFNAIGKGYIIDQTLARVLAEPGVSGALVKIGGDLRIGGKLEQQVSIRDPLAKGDNVTLPISVRLTDRAMATSGGYYRGVEIAGQHFSHIIDPRTGWPADHIASATVIGPSAVDANALSTACCVLSIGESIALVDRMPDSACLIVDKQGKTHASRAWRRLEARAADGAAIPMQAAQAALASASAIETNARADAYELVVELEINQPPGRLYRRPYVAVWVEDESGVAVRTIALWVQAAFPGPRWIPELRHWTKTDRQRKRDGGADLVPTISEATRKPGEYRIAWDGADDKGNPVKPGKYQFFIEAVREHGTYQLIRSEITLGDQPFHEDFAGNTEIKAASIDYHRIATDAAQPGK